MTTGSDHDLELVIAEDSDSGSDCDTPCDSPPPSPSRIPQIEVEPKPKRHSDVLSACAKLLLDEEYSDFKIAVGERTFPAHRNMVCSQSEFFKLALRGKDTGEGVVTITDETPKDIYRLLSYLYTNDYREMPTSFYDEGLDKKWEKREYWEMKPNYLHYATRVNITMYRLADKYGIKGLADLAVEKQDRALQKMNRVTEGVKAARKVYSIFERRDDPMRKIHLESIAAPLVEWDLREVQKVRELKLLCEEHGDFAYDLNLRLFGELDERDKRSEQAWEKVAALDLKLASYELEINALKAQLAETASVKAASISTA